MPSDRPYNYDLRRKHRENLIKSVEDVLNSITSNDGYGTYTSTRFLIRNLAQVLTDRVDVAYHSNEQDILPIVRDILAATQKFLIPKPAEDHTLKGGKVSRKSGKTGKSTNSSRKE